GLRGRAEAGAVRQRGPARALPAGGADGADAAAQPAGGAPGRGRRPLGGVAPVRPGALRTPRVRAAAPGRARGLRRSARLPGGAGMPGAAAAAGGALPLAGPAEPVRGGLDADGDRRGRARPGPGGGAAEAARFPDGRRRPMSAVGDWLLTVARAAVHRRTAT